MNGETCAVVLDISKSFNEARDIGLKFTVSPSKYFYSNSLYEIEKIILNGKYSRSFFFTNTADPCLYCRHCFFPDGISSHFVTSVDETDIYSCPERKSDQLYKE